MFMIKNIFKIHAQKCYGRRAAFASKKILVELASIRWGKFTGQWGLA
jgi:hypothetical protein